MYIYIYIYVCMCVYTCVIICMAVGRGQKSGRLQQLRSPQK